MKIEECFPCGYWYQFECGWLTDLFITFNMDKGCPLHGKDCNKYVKK